MVLVAVGGIPLGARSAAAIAYGEDAPEGEYQFSVLLTMTGLPAPDGGTRDSWCSGALIAPRWVITAGHCFRDAAGKRVSRTVARDTTATIGRTYLGSLAGRETEVVAVRQAETADVALVELGSEVTGIAPLRIGAAPPAVGETLRLTGYGLTVDGGIPTRPTWLQTGQFVIDAVGDTLLETSGQDPHRETSPCPHDSGGPYFRERADGTAELVAVVSSGPACPHAGSDLSARTDTLRAWISDTTAGTTGQRWHTGNLPFLLLALVAAALLVMVVLLRTTRRRPKHAATYWQAATRELPIPNPSMGKVRQS